MNELLHTILLRVTLAGAASAAALRMAGSGAMRETVRLAAGLLMLAALLQPLGSLRSVKIISKITAVFFAFNIFIFYY